MKTGPRKSVNPKHHEKKWRLGGAVFCALAALFFLPVSARGHNLDQLDTSIWFADEYIQLMQDRENRSEVLMQDGDEFWMIFQSTPGPGTLTGAGGYLTFYIPTNYVDVLEASYLRSAPGQPATLDSPANFRRTSLKGQSILPLGSGPIAPATTTNLIGLRLTNAFGQAENLVTATGVHRGTLAGVYADTGFFYSTDPRTQYRSWLDAPATGPLSRRGYPATMVNNRGENITPITRYDAEQLIAFGRADAPPVVDPNGRGSAPWGLGNVVAGPLSSYAWNFNLNTWLDTTNMPSAVSAVGPWQRIQYPGSQYGWDQAGLVGGALGYAGLDASSLGFSLGLGAGESQLPASANAVRVSYGMIELGRPEFAAVRLRVRNPPSVDCFTLTTDAFGGDAGGEQDAKDHEWRYYDPTIVVLNPCTYLTKIASDPIVRPGDTLHFTVTYINNGMVGYTNVVLTDLIPTGLTFLSSDPPQARGPNPLVWNLGNVAPNQMEQIRIYVRANGVGTYFNKIVATSGTNVLAEALGSVEVSYKSLLRGDKTVAPETTAPGGTVTYTLTVYNDGSGANGVPLTINEQLPPGFSYAGMVSQEINGNPLPPAFLTVASTNANRPTFTVRTGIQADQTLVLKFNAQVSSSQPVGSYCNSFQLLYEGKVVSVPPQACVTVGGGQIGDAVYRDWDGDGTQDAGEEGIPDVMVNLYTGACPAVGAPFRTAISDTNGAYLFVGLGTGSFCVAVATNTAPAGYALSSVNPLGVALTLNQAYTNADFGFRPRGAGSIAARVFNDRNGDGLFNGAEAGISNVEVRLYQDNNGNGALEGGDLLILATNTASGGTYAFTNLAAGLDYLVDADEADTDLVAYFSPNGFNNSTPALRAVSDLDGAWTDADFGYLANLPSTIGDMVFLDMNGNGTNDSADVPLPNIEVTLYRYGGGGVALDAAASDVTGHYLFTNLAPDTYLVEVDMFDSDLPRGLGAIVKSYQVVLGGGSNYLTADFPFRRFIAKTVDKTYATNNETLTYTLYPSYAGDAPLAGARVIDPFPTGVTFSNANAGGIYGPYAPLAAEPGVEEGELVEVAITNPVADTFLQQDQPNNNYNAGVRVQVKTEAGKQRIGLMLFDLAEIPADCSIASAFFSYNVQNVGNFGTLNAYRLLSDWTETGATWNTNGVVGSDWTSAGGAFGTNDYAATAYGPMTVASLGWKTNEVTDLLKAWVIDGATNNGLALIGTTPNADSAEIYDREDAGAGLAPSLTVTYQPASEITTTNSLAVSRTVMATGQTVTVTLTLWSSQTISNVVPSLEVSAGSVEISGPAETVPADVVKNTPRTFTYTCTPRAMGEMVFSGAAESEDGFSFVDSKSASVLVSANGTSNVVTWSLGTNVTGQGGVVAVSGTLPNLYAFQGKTRSFWRYSTATNAWTTRTQAPAIVDQGGALAYDGADTIYGFRGAGQKTFWAYSVSSNTWRALANTAENVRWGGALVYLNGYVYAFRGDDKVNFWRYNPAANVWSSMASAPGTVKEGGALATDGLLIYALRGDKSASFWKYSVASNAWSTLANAPGPVKKGGALAYLDGYLYGFKGDDKVDFWRYQIAGNTWSKLPAPVPDTVNGGGSIAADGTYLYAFNGDAKPYLWRYNAGAGTWSKMANAPGNVGDGGALVFVRGTASALRQVFLSTDSAMVSSGSVVTVTMEPLSSLNESNIRPSALTVAVSNGATATLLSGPTPTNIPGLSSNVTGAFRWTYRINSGTNIGRVTFSGSATNGSGQSFGTARSGNVIVVPPLTFRARVNSPITIGFVENTAIIRDLSGAIPPTLSETVYTALSPSIGDRVWADLDGDGVQDAGEPGIRDVGVWLYRDLNNNGAIDVNDVRVAETTTDLTGLYHFYGVVAGTNYTVTYDFATVPAGYLPTTDSDADSGKTVHDVGSITNGQQYLVADFGLQPPGAASIGDEVWIDANANATREATETGLGGVGVDLYLDVNTNRAIDASDYYLQTVLTDTNGTYGFHGLNTNAYLILVDDSSLVASPYGGSGTLADAMDLVSGTNPHAVTIATTNQAYAGADFGYNWSGEIGDLVWWDQNRDQIPDVDEPPISNAFVMLYVDVDGNGILELLAGDHQIAGQFTRTNGAYLFANLPPGQYLVDVYEDSIGLDGPVPTTPFVRAVALDPGVSHLDADFGYFLGARVEGNVFWDANRDQVFGLGETGLAGVSILLDGVDVYGNAVALTSITDGAGHYVFVAPEGDYSTTYSLDSVLASYPLLREETTAIRYDFHAVPGDEWHPSFDFGVDNAGRIGDTVFADLDGSGAQELGEPGLADVLMVLYDVAMNAVEFRRTDASGRYQFIGLDDGNYFVQVATNTLPAGYLTVPSADPEGPADSWASTAVLNGDVVSTMDFGYPPIPEIAYYRVSGQIYYDADTNGLAGAGEAGISNVTLRVAVDTNRDGTAEFTFAGLTDSNGYYTVAGLRSNSAVTLTVDETTLPDAAHHISGDPDGAPLTNVWTIAAIPTNAANLDFGYVATYGSVAGTVCIGDGDGLYDPAQHDIPLAFVDVTLRYSGRDGILGTADDRLLETQTALDGTYRFDTLPPGYYSISESQVAAYAYIDLADADGGDPNVIYATLALGEDKTRQDFEDTHWLGTAGLLYNAAVSSSNEYIWTDKPNEQRVENTNAINDDIRELRMFANDSNFYIRVKMSNITDDDLAYVAIGVDTRLATNSAEMAWLGDDANLGIGGDYWDGPAATHHPIRNIIVHKVGTTARAELFASDGYSWYPPPSGWSAAIISEAGETLELRIPRQDLTLDGTVTGRFTVASFLNTGLWANEGDSTVEAYPGTPDAADSIGIAPLHVNDGLLDVSAWREDISDHDVDFWVDVRFDETGIASNAVPTEPGNLLPSNNAEVGARPTLSWEASTDLDGEVTGYFLEVGTNSTAIGNGVRENKSIVLRMNLPPTQTNYVLSTSVSQYWWRVRARDTAGMLSSGPVRRFSIGGKTDADGPVPTLLYVGTNLPGFLAGDFSQYIDRYGYIQSVTDAELAQPSNRLSFAVRWDDPNGVYATNRMTADAGTNQNSFTWNILPEDGRVSPNWDAGETNPQTGSALDWVTNQVFWGTNVSAVGNAAAVLTNWAHSAFAITNFSESKEYYLKLSAEDACTQFGYAWDPGTWASYGAASPPNWGGYAADAPNVSRNVTTNYPLRIGMRDDDLLPPVAARGQGWASSRSLLASNSAALLEASRSGQNALYQEYDGPLLTNRLTLLFNVQDAYSGVQVSSNGPASTNTSLSIGFGARFDGNCANYSPARSAVANTTADTAVLAWNWDELTVDDMTELWGGDGSESVGATNPVRLTLWDNDNDRPNDQAVAANVVFGYLQLLDDDVVPPTFGTNSAVMIGADAPYVALPKTNLGHQVVLTAWGFTDEYSIEVASTPWWGSLLSHATFTWTPAYPGALVDISPNSGSRENRWFGSEEQVPRGQLNMSGIGAYGFDATNVPWIQFKLDLVPASGLALSWAEAGGAYGFTRVQAQWSATGAEGSFATNAAWPPWNPNSGGQWTLRHLDFAGVVPSGLASVYVRFVLGPDHGGEDGYYRMDNVQLTGYPEEFIVSDGQIAASGGTLRFRGNVFDAESGLDAGNSTLWVWNNDATPNAAYGAGDGKSSGSCLGWDRTLSSFDLTDFVLASGGGSGVPLTAELADADADRAGDGLRMTGQLGQLRISDDDLARPIIELTTLRQRESLLVQWAFSNNLSRLSTQVDGGLAAGEILTRTTAGTVGIPELIYKQDGEYAAQHGGWHEQDRYWSLQLMAETNVAVTNVSFQSLLGSTSGPKSYYIRMFVGGVQMQAWGPFNFSAGAIDTGTWYVASHDLTGSPLTLEAGVATELRLQAAGCDANAMGSTWALFGLTLWRDLAGVAVAAEITDDEFAQGQVELAGYAWDADSGLAGTNVANRNVFSLLASDGTALAQGQPLQFVHGLDFGGAMNKTAGEFRNSLPRLGYTHLPLGRYLGSAAVWDYDNDRVDDDLGGQAGLALDVMDNDVEPPGPVGTILVNGAPVPDFPPDREGMVWTNQPDFLVSFDEPAVDVDPGTNAPAKQRGISGVGEYRVALGVVAEMNSSDRANFGTPFPAAVPAGALANYGFEMETYGWTLAGICSVQTLADDPTRVWEGTNSLKQRLGGAASQLVEFRNVAGTAPNASVSGKYLSTAGASFKIEGFAATNLSVPLATRTVTLPVAADWSSFSLAPAEPIGSGMVEVLKLTLMNYGFGTTWWDAVRLSVDVGTNRATMKLTATPANQGYEPQYVFAVDADNNRPGDRLAGPASPFFVPYDATPPTEIHLGLGGTNAVTETVDDPTSQFDLTWSTDDVGPDDPAHANHPTKLSGDRDLLSPWRGYKIYYGPYDPLAVPADDDPTSAAEGFIYTNFVATKAYTNWQSVSSETPIADPSAASHQPTYHALTNLDQGHIRLYDLDFDEDYVVVVVGLDKAGNEGPAGYRSWATNNTIRFALIRGTTIPKLEAMAAFPEIFDPCTTNACTTAALYWLAAGATNEQGGYHEVKRDYDLISWDASRFKESASNVWQLVGTVRTNWFVDDGGYFRDRGQLRFYRASYKDRWKRTNAVGQAQQPLASEEVYALHNVVLSRGPNFVALQGMPYANTFRGVFGGLESFPGGASALPAAGATVVEFYSAGTNAAAATQYFLNSAGRWFQVGGGDVTLATQSPEFFSRGFSITLPDPLPTNFVKTTAWDYSQTGTNGAPLQVPAMIWSPVVQVPTNGFSQTIYTGGRTGRVSIMVYNVAALRLPVSAHPGEMNLIASGFVKGAPGASDEIYTMNTATKSVLSGSTIYCDANGVWRFVSGNGLVPAGYFKPNDVIVIVSRNGGLGQSWTWTYAASDFYALPTRWMGD
jgi:uncharacterized repeat protein (TIGR01451 family)